jgi:hypothetical protein
MSNFIKLSIVSSQGKENDSVAFIRPSHIVEVYTAAPYDKKLRSEVNSLITTSEGRMLAVVENTATILEKIKTAESNVPAATD